MTQIHNRSHLIRAACPCEMCKRPLMLPTGVKPNPPTDAVVREAHRLICVHGFPRGRVGNEIENALRAWLVVHDTCDGETSDQRSARHHNTIDQSLTLACALWQRGLKEPVYESLSDGYPQARDTVVLGRTPTARSSDQTPRELEC